MDSLNEMNRMDYNEEYNKAELEGLKRNLRSKSEIASRLIMK